MSSLNDADKSPTTSTSARTARCSALEHWQPDDLQWWQDTGPEGLLDDEVDLRTGVSVDPQGWALLPAARRCGP